MENIKTQKIEPIKRNKKKAPLSLKRKIILRSALVLCAVVLLYSLFYGVSSWYNKYEVIFHSPVGISIYWPVKIIKRDAIIERIIVPIIEEKKLVNEKDYVLANEHGDILWKIYQLESQRGKTDSCRLNNIGYGGFGVMSGGKIVCYDTFQIAIERADFWLMKNGIDKDLTDALCTWNLGPQRDIDKKVIPYVNCNYYQSYLTVK